MIGKLRDSIGVAMLAIATASLPAVGQEAVPNDHARATHRFEDAAKWSAIWDDPSRDAWQAPDSVIAFLSLRPGMSVADIGAGTGYFNPYLSRAVGEAGRVFAADVESTLVAYMRARAQREATPNVTAVLAGYDDPHLPTVVDRILLVDAYHHIDARIAYFGQLRRALASGGQLVVVDWKKGKLPLGPAEGHKMAPDEIIAEMGTAGWTLGARRELAYQYMLAFVPAGADSPQHDGGP